MFNRAYKILRNVQDAEDAVHEAFIKIAENIEKISQLSRHKQARYIVTIIENKAIDIYRKKQAHPTQPLYEAADYSIIDAYSDGDLARCILKLPYHDREIILLKFDLELSNKEISEILDIPQTAVRKRLQRAKAKLKEICETEGIDNANI